MRQVPSHRLPWGRTTWVSESGVVRDRYYDVQTQRWDWGSVRVPVSGRGGASGYHIDGRFRTTPHVVALAWCRRRSDMARLQRVVVPSTPTWFAHDLRWRDELDGGDSDDEVTLLDEETDDHEWRPLRFRLGLVPCARPDIWIRRDGTLRTQSGTLVRGYFGLGCERRLPIRNIGLVPLGTVASLLFGGAVARRPPPRLREVIRLLRQGHDVGQIARRRGIKEATVWTYVTDALPYVSTATAESWTLRLVDGEVAAATNQLCDESPLIMHGRLRDAMALMGRVLAAHPLWRCDPHRYAELRLGRAVRQRLYLHERESRSIEKPPPLN